MKIADANIVLRYLLNDDEIMASKSADILENQKIYLPNEVLAEIVYVLQKVYQIDNKTISSTLLDLLSFKNIKTNNQEVLKESFSLYSEIQIDFVDSILFGYDKINEFQIYTYDKKLKKYLSRDPCLCTGQ